MKHCAPIKLEKYLPKVLLIKNKKFNELLLCNLERFLSFFEKLSDLNVETAYPREI